MKVLFWLSAILLFYSYLGYPLVMFCIAVCKRKRQIIKASITPQISVVIPAYNEERNIGAKLNDILNSDYPQDRMEVFVISDASTDSTDDIVKGFADRGVKLFRLNERSGKIAAYRKVLPLLKGEIIIFSDATSILETDSISNLINNFYDESVGCAGGLLMYINPKDATIGNSERKYWKYEKNIRRMENQLSSLPSVSGTFYAVRKKLYPLDMKDDLADDLIVPFNVRKAGLRTVLEPSALCKDFTTLNIQDEMGKRVRITVQNIRGLLAYPEILNPFKYGLFSLLVISHKLFRLLAPIFMIVLFVSNLFLSFHSWLFLLVFIAQVAFYAAGINGYTIYKRTKFSLANTLFYFCLSNLAVFIGMIKFFNGEKVISWETVRA